jgi:hypothetical protein
MDNHRSDASVLNLSDRLSNEAAKFSKGNSFFLINLLFHFSVNLEYFIKNQSIENLLLKNEKFQVKDEDEHRK